MKVLHGNTFLYFGDKNVSKVSGVWKALHISIYVAIAVNTFITSMALGNMFQTFKYNCILYCNEIEFEKEHVPVDTFKQSKSIVSNSLNSFEPEEEAENNTMIINDQNITETMLNTMKINDTVLKNNTDTLNSDIKPTDNDNANRNIIFKNETHVFQMEEDSVTIIHGKIDVRKTRFSSDSWCNFVLGIALITFIFATFCGALLAMCSKGGRGRENLLNRPQNMVYPILISSIFLGILNLVTSSIIKSGMRDFCANFELFTDDESCSPIINQFTIHERQPRFFLPYIILSYSASITVVLFACQILVTLLRIMYAVDYQLYALEIDDNEEDNDFEIEDGRIKESERAL